jgi:hypothetical protein
VTAIADPAYRSTSIGRQRPTVASLG